MTGTLAEMVPVTKVNGRSIDSGKVGPVTGRIYSEFAKVRSMSSEGVEICPEASGKIATNNGGKQKSVYHGSASL